MLRRPAPQVALAGETPPRTDRPPAPRAHPSRRSPACAEALRRRCSPWPQHDLAPRLAAREYPGGQSRGSSPARSVEELPLPDRTRRGRWRPPAARPSPRSAARVRRSTPRLPTPSKLGEPLERADRLGAGVRPSCRSRPRSLGGRADRAHRPQARAGETLEAPRAARLPARRFRRRARPSRAPPTPAPESPDRGSGPAFRIASWRRQLRPRLDADLADEHGARGTEAGREPPPDVPRGQRASMRRACRRSRSGCSVSSASRSGNAGGLLSVLEEFGLDRSRDSTAAR